MCSSDLQISIPTGVGMFITYKRNHRFGWEFNVRKTFTDYLDDAKGFYISHPEGSLASIYANPYNEDNATINKENYFEGSPRGNHVDDDWYLSSVFTYSYVMRGKSNFVRKKLKYTYGSSKRKKRTKAKF